MISSPDTRSDRTDAPGPIEWTILGGGVHGTHLALRLLGECRVSARQLAVVDPHTGPLGAWRTISERIGMAYLRSPRVHHIGADPYDLADFAQAVRGRLDRSPYRGPYRRPSLELFLRHVDALSQAAGLADAWRVGEGRSLERTDDGSWIVHTDRGSWQSRRVVLALGPKETAPWPAWAMRAAHLVPGRVVHAFDLDRGIESDATSVVVVGGGLTAAQWALRLAEDGMAVSLVTRHRLEVESFDTDPGWLGPRFMDAFRLDSDPVRRRRAVDDARLSGTVTGEIRLALADAKREGRLNIVEGRIVDVEAVEGPEPLRLHVSTGETGGADTAMNASWVGLGTGYSSARPGGALVDDLVERYHPATAPCGFPLVSAELEWLPHLYVTGGLAELEIGPVARNIAGARRAAERILGRPPRRARRRGLEPFEWIPFPLLASPAPA